VEYLSDVHRKAEFYHKTSNLVSSVSQSEAVKSVKESWRRTKQLKIINLTQENTNEEVHEKLNSLKANTNRLLTI